MTATEKRAYIEDYINATRDGILTDDELAEFVVDSLADPNELGEDVSDIVIEIIFGETEVDQDPETSEIDQLALDYDEFEYDYDPYGYGDAFSDREEAQAATRNALADADFRKAIIDRLAEIADEDDEHTAPALALIERIRALEN